MAAAALPYEPIKVSHRSNDVPSTCKYFLIKDAERPSVSLKDKMALGFYANHTIIPSFNWPPSFFPLQDAQFSTTMLTQVRKYSQIGKRTRIPSVGPDAVDEQSERFTA